MAATALFVSGRAGAVGAGEETRALWVVRHAITTPGRVDRVVDLSTQMNVNTLLVQVRGRGDAYYQSDLAPRAEELEAAGPDFDPLERIVRRGHAAGLEVHAWLNAYLVWSRGEPPQSALHVVNVHPDWISVRSNGQRLVEMVPQEFEAERMEGMYLAPGNPEVRRHLRDIVREIVDRYAVDGIHLDYIRYPEPGVGYDAATRTGFMREFGIDPAQFEQPDSALIDLVAPEGIQDLRGKWEEWKRAQITALVRDIRNDLDLIRPGIKLTAAVIADQAAALGRYGQDWPSWLREGILDAVIAMAYSPSTPIVVRQLEAARAIPTDRHVYAGIAIYNEGARDAAEKIRRARALGVDGIALFSYDRLQESTSYARSIRSWAFREPVAPTAMPWRK
ncbi:MAG TPA: family 10 glycosylhydrolase [Candidatus Eisenbacteria bacterium]